MCWIVCCKNVVIKCKRWKNVSLYCWNWNLFTGCDLLSVRVLQTHVCHYNFWINDPSITILIFIVLTIIVFHEPWMYVMTVGMNRLVCFRLVVFGLEVTGSAVSWKDSSGSSRMSGNVYCNLIICCNVICSSSLDWLTTLVIVFTFTTPHVQHSPTVLPVREFTELHNNHGKSRNQTFSEEAGNIKGFNGSLVHVFF